MSTYVEETVYSISGPVALTDNMGIVRDYAGFVLNTQMCERCETNSLSHAPIGRRDDATGKAVLTVHVLFPQP